MDLSIATELLAALLKLSSTHQSLLVAIAVFIGGGGLVIGRWSSAHTRAKVEADNSNLKNRIEALVDLEKQAALPSIEELTFEQGLYYTAGSGMRLQIEGHEKSDGPYCPRCWEVDRVKVSLQKQELELVCVNKPCGFTAVAHERKNSQMTVKLSRAFK